MCGRFVSSTPPDQLAAYFDVDALAEQLLDRGPNHNTAPTSDVVAVRQDGSVRRLEALRWGLVPSWAKDVAIGNKLINARAETVATKPAFRSAFAKRRCIIPADGFYEWTRPEGAARKQPWYIHRPDDEPFAFAGIWSTWRGSGGATPRSEEAGAPVDEVEPLRTCSIITTVANEAMSELHDRMPVILPREAWGPWLDEEQDDTELLGRFLVPAPSELIAFHPVSIEVNDARHRGEHLIDPIPPSQVQGSDAAPSEPTSRRPAAGGDAQTPASE